jgi:hypothetical protein
MGRPVRAVMTAEPAMMLGNGGGIEAAIDRL